MTRVMKFRINVKTVKGYEEYITDGYTLISGETKEEAEKYAKMAGWTITGQTTHAEYKTQVMVEPPGIMPFSGDPYPATFDWVTIVVEV